MLNDALWPVLRACVDAGDLPGARAAWERAMSERDATYFARERGESREGEPVDADGDVFEGEGYEGVATAVMAAAVQRRKVPLILNVPNRGAIGGLRDDDVVEVTCLADEHGAHPLAQGAMPEAALALVGQVKLYERLTVTAAVEGSYDAALDALLAHPLVASYPSAKAILDGYVDDLSGLLPPLSPRSDAPVKRRLLFALIASSIVARDARSPSGIHRRRAAAPRPTGPSRRPLLTRPASRVPRPDRGAGRGRDAHLVRCRRIGCRRPRSFGPGPDARSDSRRGRRTAHVSPGWPWPPTGRPPTS